jgi:hypothetical protein
MCPKFDVTGNLKIFGKIFRTNQTQRREEKRERRPDVVAGMCQEREF